jgi:hypothetical protein
MIKIVLVVFAMTAQGPVAREVAEFTNANRQYCEDVGTLVVRNLGERNIRAAYRCIGRTVI